MDPSSTCDHEASGTPATIDSLLVKAAEGDSARLAFPGQRCSAKELSDRAEQFAGLLATLGLGPSAKIAVWLPPSLDLVAAIFGAARAGCVAVPVSDRFRSVELRHVLRQADVGVLLTTDNDAHLDRMAILAQALPSLHDDGGQLELDEAPVLRHIVLRERIEPTSTMPPRRLSSDDLAMLMFTSGTSAAAKACMLTHASLLAQARVLAEDRYLLSRDSVVWSPLPLFHVAGLVSLLATLHAEAAYIHSGVFDPATTLSLLASERPTHALAAFETIWMQLLDEAARRGSDLSSISVGLSANGEPQLRKLQERLPNVAFIANYGSTEGSGHVAMGRPDEPERVRLAGGALPLPGAEVQIVEPGSQAPVPVGEPGEIQFRGVYRFGGYYRDDGATAASITREGWFKSGDVGNLDEAGRLYFRGRLKEMLKVGGENVSALEVEAFLITHPNINVAAVVGVPDDHYGEVAAAFIELASGHELSEEEVIAFCLGSIASFKVPRYVRIVSEWPMSGTKVKKSELVTRLVDELRAAGITAAPRLRSGVARRPLERNA